MADELSALVAELLDTWELTLDGPPFAGGTRSHVLPVRTTTGAAAVLKVGVPHREAEHESLALQHWHGRGAVRLLRADPPRFALLLERLHADDLTERWDLEACEIVADLYTQLHLPALPQLRLLTSYVQRWTDDLRALPRNAPIPRRLVEQAAAIGRDFVADADSIGRIIHGDLHYANVLAADRAPWLVIDPKPMSGDPHYEVAPLLWNRFDELAGDVRDGVRRRFHTVIDRAGFDEARARDWVVLRMVVNAMWGIGVAVPDPAEDVTLCVAVAKAVQD